MFPSLATTLLVFQSPPTEGHVDNAAQRLPGSSAHQSISGKQSPIISARLRHNFYGSWKKPYECLPVEDALSSLAASRPYIRASEEVSKDFGEQAGESEETKNLNKRVQLRVRRQATLRSLFILLSHRSPLLLALR